MKANKGWQLKPHPNIMIVGCGGSGKSDLATKLSNISGLRVIHIDLLSWKPGWVKRSQEEMDLLIKDAIREDSWIFEGDNAASFHMRAARSGLIIWLDFPRYICLWRAILRTLKHYGKARPDLYEGCYKRFSWEYWKFLKWIWNFNKNSRPKIERLMKETEGLLDQVVLKTPQGVRQFLDDFRKNEHD